MEIICEKSAVFSVFFQIWLKLVPYDIVGGLRLVGEFSLVVVGGVVKGDGVFRVYREDRIYSIDLGVIKDDSGLVVDELDSFHNFKI